MRKTGSSPDESKRGYLYKKAVISEESQFAPIGKTIRFNNQKQNEPHGKL
jgi:hypothetical protein